MRTVHQSLPARPVASEHMLSWAEAIDLAKGILGMGDGGNRGRDVGLVHILFLAHTLEHIFPQGPLSLRV